MKLFLSLFLFVFNYPCFAQKTEAPPAPGNKVIRLPKYPLADLPKKSPVSEIRIIQFVTDSVHLGYVQKGMDNQITMLVTSKPLTGFLQEHIEKMYGDDYKPNGLKMLWVLKDLRIAEKTAFTEYAYLRFNADAYILSANESGYTKLSSIDTVFFHESGGDVTAWHGQRLEDAMKLLLQKALKSASEKPESFRAVPLEEIVDAAKPNLDVPILKDTVFPEGGYVSFEEFLQNKPSVNALETVSISKSEVRFLKANSVGGKDSIDLWGISKGGELYKYADGQLVPIERSGNGFIISDFIEKHNRRNSNIFMSSLIGGVAGGLIAGSGRKNRPYLVTNIRNITKPKKQPEASIIDMKTGELAF